jgi:hypothetical protein
MLLLLLLLLHLLLLLVLLLWQDSSCIGERENIRSRLTYEVHEDCILLSLTQSPSPHFTLPHRVLASIRKRHH